CVERDITLAGEAIRSAERGRIHVFLSTSDLHLEAKLRISREEAIERIRAGVRQARRYTDDVEWSAEDASRSDRDFLCRAVEVAIAEGATTINLPDTVGFALPDEYAAMFREVMTRVPGADRVVFSAHCHDDLGLAVANSLAAIGAGCGQVECTINGIGERAGNAALEEIVMAAHVRQQLGYATGINTRELFRTSQLLSHATGSFPQPNKAIVGRNAFAHEAGIHQHGVLQNGLTYEIIEPETVGITKSSLVLGRHSGRHALAQRFRELGYDLDEARLQDLYRAFTQLAERKKQILDEDLIALHHESFHDVPEEFALRHLRVVCGSGTPEATVTLQGPWTGERTATGTGDGPIAAAFAAVSEIVGRTVEVESLNLRSVTPGRDSVGQVFLQVRVDGRTFSAHSASTDIVEASARALVNALNKSRHAEVLEAEHMASVNYWGV
ncbi:MAG TPA: 2-isopropylmalate synthase, partial [Gemmatimonadales bacterium]|nr:2-isopropylmalate synthase [Gemmatimonadales bacterium]